MPAWATVVLTLGVSAIAVAGTLAATWLQHRFATRQRREAEWIGLRDRGAEVFGPIETLLEDTDPVRLDWDSDNRNSEWAEEIQTRWQNLRHELAIYANAHSVRQVGTAARRVSIAVGDAVNGSIALRQKRSGETRRAVHEAHNRARALLEVTVAAIRNDIPPHDAASKAAEIERNAGAQERSG